MKLIKLNAVEDCTIRVKEEEIYINADNIIFVRQTSEYSEIDVAYPHGDWRRWKVKETVENIQEQLRGTENDK